MRDQLHFQELEDIIFYNMLFAQTLSLTCHLKTRPMQVYSVPKEIRVD